MADELDPSAWVEQTLAGFKRKADHNKTEALWCFIAVVGFTLLAPLFVMLGDGYWLGKVVPSVLSLGAAAVTTWLQLRKPQQLWALYRTCQRRIELVQKQHEYGFGGFEKAVDRKRLLVQRVSEIAMFAHEQWMPLVPSPESLGATTEKKLQATDGGKDGDV